MQDLQEGAWGLDDLAQLERFWPGGRFLPVGDQPFRGRVFRRRLPQVRLEGISATPYAAARTAALAERPEGDLLVISAIVDGTAEIRGKGTLLVARPGDVFVHRSTPFEYRCATPSRTFRTASDVRLVAGAAGERFRPFALAPRSVLSHAFVRFASEVLHSVDREPPLLTRAAETLQDALLVLERALIAELMVAEGRALPRDEGLRLQAERWIEDHLLEPDLTVDGIAAALSISRRRLYQLFEGEEETLGASIRRRRVELAASVLRDEPQIAVRHLAVRAGFAGPDVLARAFRGQYGMSVSDYRARGAPDADSSNGAGTAGSRP